MGAGPGAILGDLCPQSLEAVKLLFRAQIGQELHPKVAPVKILGEVEEKSRNYLASVAQYEQAARMDPSEQNILNWGAELLLHQTFAPAVEVFKAGTQRYPQSAHPHRLAAIRIRGAGW